VADLFWWDVSARAIAAVGVAAIHHDVLAVDPNAGVEHGVDLASG